jgi:UDP-glucose 4-epimerase
LNDVEVHEGDFSNQVDVREALKGCSAAVHLVSSTLPATSNENPAYDIESNVVSTLRFLDESRAQGLRRILFISSGGTIYGRARDLPITEDHPTDPLCSYAIGKLAIEKYLELYRHFHGLQYSIFRFANPYGERQNPAGAQGAVAVFLGRVLMRQPIEIWGSGDAVRDYVYIGDAVRAVRMVLERDPPDRLFNVGSGVGISINELVEEIRKATGSQVSVVRKPGRPLDVAANVLDSSRLARNVGWTPQVTLAEGLKKTWEWMKGALAASPGRPENEEETAGS